MANLQVSVTSANNLAVEVTPVANQTIQIDKGRIGPAGPPGPNTIGGYPISIFAAQNYDALMFLNNTWVNIPQTEIADGGNY